MANDLRIREIDRESEAEIEIVAQRMRATLIEVEGEEIGMDLYTLAWLRQRVRWHLDHHMATAQVLLALDGQGEIIGHTIVRRESEAEGDTFGLFSTTYVVQHARRVGVGAALLDAGEHWMQSLALATSVTWTSATNGPLIRLYTRRGYRQTATHIHERTGTLMIKLERRL